jgi:hypothetical protein
MIVDFSAALSGITDLCTLFIAWLSLRGGISRETANTVLKALHLIVSSVVQLVLEFLQSTFGINLAPPSLDIPADLRTIFNRSAELNPEITRTVCCLKCFSLYPLNDDIPEYCTMKKSRRAKACREPLLTTRRTRTGCKMVPRRLYSTQTFESWLKFFLGRPNIEDIINKSYQHTPPAGEHPQMHGLWDSPAWRSIGEEFAFLKGNLTFGFYIDWFNPFTMKIAGIENFPLVI